MNNMLWICHSYEAAAHFPANNLVAQMAAMCNSYSVLFSKACILLQNIPSNQVEAFTTHNFINSLIDHDTRESVGADASPYSIKRESLLSLISSAQSLQESTLAHEIYELDIHALQDLAYLGVPIGEYALIDLSLCRKTTDPSHFPGFYRHTLYLCSVYLKFLASLQTSPGSIILENEYAYCKSCEHYAQHRMAATVIKYTFPTTDPHRIAFYKDQFFDVFIRRALAYSSLIFPQEYKSYQFAIDYIRSKIIQSGTSQSYSPNLDAWQKGSDIDCFLNSSKKTIAYFSSSADEITSARISFKHSPVRYVEKERPFLDEFDFIPQLIDYSRMRGHQLVIRLHPRLAQNPRESFRSPLLDRWKDVLSDTKDDHKIYIVWPDDQINSYHIGVRASISTYWWSTVGMELALLGSKVFPAVHDTSTENIRYELFGSDWPVNPRSWFQTLEDMINGESDQLMEPLYAAKCFFFSVAYGSIEVNAADISDREYLSNILESGSFLASIAHGSNKKADLRTLAKARLKYLLFLQNILTTVFSVSHNSYHYKMIENCLFAHILDRENS